MPPRSGSPPLPPFRCKRPPLTPAHLPTQAKPHWTPQLPSPAANPSDSTLYGHVNATRTKVKFWFRPVHFSCLKCNALGEQASLDCTSSNLVKEWL
jgi:hypothetical protein